MSSDTYHIMYPREPRQDHIKKPLWHFVYWLSKIGKIYLKFNYYYYLKIVALLSE